MSEDSAHGLKKKLWKNNLYSTAVSEKDMVGRKRFTDSSHSETTKHEIVDI